MTLKYIKDELGSHSFSAWMEDTLRAYELNLIHGERQQRLYEFIDSSMRTRFEQRKTAFQERRNQQQPASRTNL